MKFTSKISLIIAIALLISVGGVYAAWNYVNYEFGSATSDDTRSLGVIIANQFIVNENVPAGTIQVTPGRHAIEIDQDPEKEVLGHYGKITWGGTAAQVSYIPNEVSSDGGAVDNIPEAIDILVTIEISGTNAYDFAQEDGSTKNDSPILVIKSEGTLPAYGEATKNKASFLIEDLEQNQSTYFDLAEYLFVSEDLCLPSVTDYTAFKAFLETAGLKVTVTFKDLSSLAP